MVQRGTAQEVALLEPESETVRTGSGKVGQQARCGRHLEGPDGGVSGVAELPPHRVVVWTVVTATSQGDLQAGTNSRLVRQPRNRLKANKRCGTSSAWCNCNGAVDAYIVPYA